MSRGTHRLCEGRVVVVTGAGRGLGRAHALAYAAEGARVVVNDLGVGLDGTPNPDSPAARVVEEIRAAGGDAVAHGGDIATTDGAASLVHTALDTYGRLDTLVNNAGFLRDRMLVNLDEDDWDAVLRVHLKGHFLTLRHAAAHWRAETKAAAHRPRGSSTPAAAPACWAHSARATTAPPRPASSASPSSPPPNSPATASRPTPSPPRRARG